MGSQVLVLIFGFCSQSPLVLLFVIFISVQKEANGYMLHYSLPNKANINFLKNHELIE